MTGLRHKHWHPKRPQRVYDREVRSEALDPDLLNQNPKPKLALLEFLRSFGIAEG